MNSAIIVALARLRAAEWSNPAWTRPICPVCEETREAGHRVDCDLHAAIVALASVEPTALDAERQVVAA